MTITDGLLKNAEAYAKTFDKERLAIPLGAKVAVVTCMDARVDVYGIFGLTGGDAHVIRNAGGVVTEDVVRSLTLSQRLLGTTEVLIVHHTDCGMLTFADEEMSDRIAADTGLRPPFAFGAFPDLDDDVRRSVDLVNASPFIPHKESVRGFVYEVETGRLRTVV